MNKVNIRFKNGEQMTVTAEEYLTIKSNIPSVELIEYSPEPPKAKKPEPNNTTEKTKRPPDSNPDIVTE